MAHENEYYCAYLTLIATAMRRNRNDNDSHACDARINLNLLLAFIGLYFFFFAARTSEASRKAAPTQRCFTLSENFQQAERMKS